MKRHVASQAMEIPLESWWHFGRNPTNGICCQRSCMWFLPAMEISLGYLDFSFLVLTDVIENHHEPPQNESWFLVWILSKVPRYSILCYIMLYIIQYIYTHLWSSHKVPIFSKNFSARRTYGSAVEQASTKPGPKPESRYGVCCRHGRHGMIGGWWDGHRWTKQLIKKRGKKRGPLGESVSLS